MAFPTETVYGLGGNASHAGAVRKIFDVKERPYDHPLIVHIASMTQLSDWAREVSPLALQLATAFWPGPLTLVLKKQPHVLDEVTGTQDTVGLRIPRHPLAQALLTAFGGGIAAPSANKFTRISPTTAAAVQDELGSAVDLILDGGACSVGLESTIIDMSQTTPVILRPGMVTTQQIVTVIGMEVATWHQEIATLRAPGMHQVHYAPTTKTKRIETQDMLHVAQTLAAEEGPLVCLVYSDMAMQATDKIGWIKMPSNATQYAHDLYHTLRLLDHQHWQWILIEAVPERSEWDAIHDRIFKATAGRRKDLT